MEALMVALSASLKTPQSKGQSHQQSFESCSVGSILNRIWTTVKRCTTIILADEFPCLAEVEAGDVCVHVYNARSFE